MMSKKKKNTLPNRALMVRDCVAVISAISQVLAETIYWTNFKPFGGMNHYYIQDRDTVVEKDGCNIQPVL